MNKKKITTVVVLLAFLAIAVTGGTLAYFTDTDVAENVMKLGNVKITQNEEDRDGAAYVDNQKLFPLVPLVTEWWVKDATIPDTDGTTSVAIWDANFNNEIDKFVSVTNEGTESAYVRTILLFETKRSYEVGSSDKWTDLHDHFFVINGDYDYLEGSEANNRVIDSGTGETAFDFMYVTIDGTEYVVAVKTYDDALDPGETTKSSLRQFALTWEADNDVYDFFGEEYNILALSQAVQVQGFETGTAEAALNTGFGEINPTNIALWF